MSDQSQAVFLSYASQDVAAAERICEVLRAADMEVWFDKAELRGGEAWDRQINDQIHRCRLFIPVISANTEARDEGYFRREWRLAVERAGDMAEHKTFLVPVVIDGTVEGRAAVPDRFRHIHWLKLPGGEPSPAFVNRIATLIGKPTRDGTADDVAGAPASSPLPRRTLRRPIWAGTVASLLAMTLGGGWYAWLHLGHRTPAAGQPLVDEKSIAVLPFVDLSEKKDQEYFSDGLSEELIDLLTKIPDLRVPARTSSFYFKGKPATVPEIAKALSVSHVLEGSVRKAGIKLRITVQLIRADNGYHVWSNTYDRQVSDIFKVQDDIAGAVVDALKVTLLRANPVASAHYTPNSEAYDQYLIGKQAYNRDEYAQARDAFRRAVALDGQFAVAYAGLAEAEGDLSDIVVGDRSGLQRALDAASKAVELAPNQPEGYAARGEVRYVYFRDWSGGRADIEKALAYDPRSSWIQLRYADLLGGLGLLPQAAEAARKAVELDPLSAVAWRKLGLWLMNARQFDAAAGALNRSRAIADGSPYVLWYIAQLDVINGHADQALALVPSLIQDQCGPAHISAIAEHSLGHDLESNRALDDLLTKYVSTCAYQIADAYAWRLETNQAFEWLERAYTQHDSGLLWIKTDPFLDGIRGDPRYAVLLRKLGLS